MQKRIVKTILCMMCVTIMTACAGSTPSTTHSDEKTESSEDYVDSSEEAQVINESKDPTYYVAFDNSDNSQGWIESLLVLTDECDYSLVLDISALVCDYEMKGSITDTDKYMDFLNSSEPRVRFYNPEDEVLNQIFLKYGWINNQMCQNITFSFDGSSKCNMLGFTFSGDDITPLVDELKQFFSMDSKVSIIDNNKYELDLGGYLAEIKNLSVYGGDANSWDVTVSKK